MTEADKTLAVYTCQDCGAEFEDRWDKRRRFCRKCEMKKLSRMVDRESGETKKV
jgi:DNA-directed RNA polymerase subunit RPC12/RpoP